MSGNVCGWSRSSDHRCAGLDDAVPALAVQQFDLHSARELFDHGIVVTVTDSSPSARTLDANLVTEKTN